MIAGKVVVSGERDLDCIMRWSQETPVSQGDGAKERCLECGRLLDRGEQERPVYLPGSHESF